MTEFTNEFIEKEKKYIQSLRFKTHAEELFLQAIDYIECLQQRIAELEQERRWIPVSERLPEEEQEALVSYGDGNWIISAYIYDGKWFDIPYDSPISPTHWQPLPQDPQEEE